MSDEISQDIISPLNQPDIIQEGGDLDLQNNVDENNQEIVGNKQNDSFQSINEFNDENIMDFQSSMQIIFEDDANNIYQNCNHQLISDDIYFHNIIHNSNPQTTKLDEEPLIQKQHQKYDNPFQGQDVSNLKNDNIYNQTKNCKASDSFTNNEKDSLQTHRFSIKQIQDYILNNSELGKKYKKKTVCPSCLKANLQMFEINKEESIFMCTNMDCTFPFENEDLQEFTFQTKYKKRIFNKMKNKIRFKYNPPIEIFFEEQDVTKAIQELEQTE